MVEPGYTCGDCYFCRQGRENLCQQRSSSRRSSPSGPPTCAPIPSTGPSAG
ncbi:MAG: hypothetical protein ACREJI_08845 [Candidatus Methylomirabilales bacterium]